jgi:hypothetical protein
LIRRRRCPGQGSLNARPEKTRRSAGFFLPGVQRVTLTVLAVRIMRITGITVIPVIPMFPMFPMLHVIPVIPGAMRIMRRLTRMGLYLPWVNRHLIAALDRRSVQQAGKDTARFTVPAKTDPLNAEKQVQVRKTVAVDVGDADGFTLAVAFAFATRRA